VSAAAPTPLASFARAGFGFELLHEDRGSRARRGRFLTPHGVVETPAFMPVGTKGTVKGVFPRDLKAVGSTMILANTYHLHLRPGEDLVAQLGGLHRLMDWDGPILTDSGGYQVFSLGNLTKIDEDGVSTRSIVDGSPLRLDPERAVRIQAKLGADVQMAFDHCPADPTNRDLVSAATARTARWLERCVAEHERLGGLARGQALFGIVQGGAFPDLRAQAVADVAQHDLVGCAVGGVSVGEDREQMRIAVESAAPLLPRDRPRYLMGVGTPLDFFDAVERGIDLFDCVSPTRNARTHKAWTSRGEVNLKNAKHKEDDSPLDPECHCPCCLRYPRAVLRHLVIAEEMLAPMLITLHNLRYFHRLMERMREAIVLDRFMDLRREVLSLRGEA